MNDVTYWREAYATLLSHANDLECGAETATTPQEKGRYIRGAGVTRQLARVCLKRAEMLETEAYQHSLAAQGA